MDELSIADLVKQLIKTYSYNLEAILQYGSSIHGELPVDLDIIIILKNKNKPSEDLSELKKIIETYPDLSLDLQLFYSFELSNPNLFSLDAHGAFFIEPLKHALVLYGYNPFLKLELEYRSIQISTVNKVQNYVFRMRQEAMGIGRYSKDRSPSYHKKKIMRILDDILIFDRNIDSRKNILERFLNNFSDILEQKEVEMLSEDKVYNLERYIPIYEKLYNLILQKANMQISEKKIKPTRLNINGIISEIIAVEDSKGVIILLDGLPSKPDEEELMSILANQGYSVVFPRYAGTWESSGQFLNVSPTNDVIQLTSAIKNGLQINGINLPNDNIIIIATSFGGSVALCLPEDDAVKKIILLSPVYDYTKVSGLETLSPFLKDKFTGAYRYNDQDWNKLLKGKLLKPKNNLIHYKDYSKFKIYAGEEDKSVPIDKLIDFAKEFSIDILSYKDMGHMSFSKIKGILLEDILRVINI